RHTHSRTPRPGLERPRSLGNQRGICSASSGLPGGLGRRRLVPREPGSTRTRPPRHRSPERRWRCHRHRTSGGRFWRPYRAASPSGTARPWPQARHGRNLHRRRPGWRHAARNMATRFHRERSGMSTPILDLQNFDCRLDEAGVAWLGIDCADSSVNRLSRAVLAEFNTVLDHFERNRPAGLVIHSLKESGFIAGADIDEFDTVTTPDSITELIRRGWNTFERLEGVHYPTLALIHGHCVGGGLELALACRYRLGVDQPSTSFALPEVQLGIFPAWGGMQRLPALIGAPTALDLMLTGRSVDVRKAAQLGIVDAPVPPRLKMQAAARHVLSGKPARRSRGLGRLLNHKALRQLVMKQITKKVNERDPYLHYMAPRAILEIWARHDGNTLAAPLLMSELARSDTARNLLRVFRLQERLKAFG